MVKAHISQSTAPRKTWKNSLDSRWFAIFDLACAAVGILAGRLYPDLAGPMLLIALVPWTLRLVAGRFPFKRAQLEGWIAIFMLTAVVGAFDSYQPGEAWQKFWLLTGGVMLFYAVAGQPAENRTLVAAMVCIFSAGVAGYFLLTNDWNLFPAKLTVLNQVGMWWMKTRPAWISGRLYHNIAAGVIAFSLPFTAALVITAWRKRKILFLSGIILCGLIALSGFLMTTSRGALLALFAGCVVGVLQLAAEKHIPLLPHAAISRFKTPLILIFLLAAGLGFLFLAGPVNFVESDPALSSSGSRLELFGRALQLVNDFPFTGGGLSTFPGMYSHYMLGIPDFFYLSSHDLYLNIAHEQGPLGWLAFCGLYLTILLRTLRAKDEPVSLLVVAALASLTVILLHNLVDNILDDPGFAFLLFLFPGVILAVLPPKQAKLSPQPATLQSETLKPVIRWLPNPIPQRWATGLGIAGLFLLAWVFRLPLLAAGYANLGALSMAQIELAGFPATQSLSHLAELAPAEANFQRALQFDPANRTANHRLGLLAVQRLDFQSAVTFLEKAHQADLNHRGIAKELGYAYVWLGEYELAFPLLRMIPEAGAELDTYIFWWPTQGRTDLADNARQMILVLNTSR